MAALKNIRVKLLKDGELHRIELIIRRNEHDRDAEIGIISDTIFLLDVLKKYQVAYEELSSRNTSVEFQLAVAKNRLRNI
jgi:hypothetical protein